MRRRDAPRQWLPRVWQRSIALLVTSGAITKNVDRLVEAGMAERLPDPGHNGGFLVRLTKRGQQAVEETVDQLARHSMLAPAMAKLTPEERESGCRFALRVLSLLEESEMGDSRRETE